MDLFEYQGKQFFAEYGMPTSPGKIAFTIEEAVQAADRADHKGERRADLRREWRRAGPLAEGLREEARGG